MLKKAQIPSASIGGRSNDYRWIDAGYEAGILDLPTIQARVRFGMDYPGDKDRQKVKNGIESHRAAMLSDGTLAWELLAFLRSDEARRIATPIDDDYSYSGPIVWADGDRAVQLIDEGTVVVHRIHGWINGKRSMNTNYSGRQLAG